MRVTSEQSWATADRAETAADELVQAKTGGNDSTAPQAPVHPEHLGESARHCDTATARPPGDRRLCRALAADHETTRSNRHHGHVARTEWPYREFQNIEELEERRPQARSDAAS